MNKVASAAVAISQASTYSGLKTVLAKHDFDCRRGLFYAKYYSLTRPEDLPASVASGGELGVVTGPAVDPVGL